jgi:hypothetical protein
MILAAAETTWIILAAVAGLIVFIYVAGGRLANASLVSTSLPQQVTIKVQGGPDHGHVQQEVMPQDLETFFAFLRSMTKFRMLQSHVTFKLEPEPTVTVTRDATHLERFKHDPKPQGGFIQPMRPRYDSIEEPSE